MAGRGAVQALGLVHFTRTVGESEYQDAPAERRRAARVGSRFFRKPSREEGGREGWARRTASSPLHSLRGSRVLATQGLPAYRPQSDLRKGS